MLGLPSCKFFPFLKGEVNLAFNDLGRSDLKVVHMIGSTGCFFQETSLAASLHFQEKSLTMGAYSQIIVARRLIFSAFSS